MKNPETNQERRKNLKKKLASALVMLLIASILMTTTSYAWLVLSIAPEVTGITTNIGANGSLEIALLTTETWSDLSTIRTAVGESLANRVLSANNTWGNLVDLSDISYGLSSITLLPSRLNVISTGDSYSVDTGMLSIPTYGYDGRIIELTDDTISATYLESEFSYTVGLQDYGVRAIGTTDSLSVQGSTLAMAKSNIATYTNSAKNAVTSVMDNSGDTLFNIVLSHAMDSGATYGDTDLEALKGMLKDLQTTLDYIDLALRQGVVAVAASEISNEDTFTQVKDKVMDTSQELSQILTGLSEVDAVPEEFNTWITTQDNIQNDLNAAITASESLSGGSYTWQEFRTVLDYIMNVDGVYINGTLFSNFNSSTAGDLIGGDVALTLAPGSGIFAGIADFTGNYSVILTYVGTNIEIATASAVSPAYLTALAAAVKDLEAADSNGEEAEAVALTATYGYALDLAFRCNAPASELLLQTTPEQRVYSDSTSGSTLGGGSFMEFTSTDENLTLEQKLKLMDAVRVGFLDDQGNILGIAKLNTSNRTTTDGIVNAPLYLYEYSFSEEDGSMIMGERRKTDNAITGLEQSVAKAVTVIVWLDGDIVDNSMVSATEAASLNGTLNLQFASSANLVPASNSDLLNLTADKAALEALILDNAETAEAGQGTYTTVSWERFIIAYNYAVSVSNNANASEAQVYNSALNLSKAAAALEEVSQEAVQNKIAELREMMGETADLARYVIANEDGTYTSVGGDGYTQEEYDSWTIVGEVYRVDYANNLNDEGNDIYTPVYTDESWSALAAALYQAEAVTMTPKATDAQLNGALTAMETAYDALERQIFYKPYDYNGTIYYEAICDADNADTYGKWYDSDFKRVVADITILNLDAYAEPVDIAEIEQNEYVSVGTDMITPYINILDEVYPELKGEEVQGVHWNEFDSNYFTEVMGSYHVAALNTLIGIVNDEELSVDTTAAENLVNSTAAVSLATAESTIASLESNIIEALKAKADASTDMTDSTRILLTTAVNSAKSVPGYSDTTKTELAALRSATEAAEALLTQEKVPAETDATAALSALNTQLKAAKVDEVTEYNTLTYTIPMGSEVYELVYAVEYPVVSLQLTGETGASAVGAIVVTENGIVFTVAKNVSIYVPADGAKIYDPESKGADGTYTEEKTSLALEAGSADDLAADLFFTAAALAENHGETVKSYTWSSSDTSIAAITGKSAQSCTVNALVAGEATISLSIETVQGNVYTTEITLTVNP